MEHLVAVYGSLKQGHFNHDLLKGSEFVGEDRLFEFTLYDLGLFPAIKRGGSESVLVEIYRVSTEQLHRLDKLEGYNQGEPHKSLYLRIEVESSFGSVWVYE
ncbi:gamma-glutamylcyclotransferase family protein [Nitrincola iocasae]|uniref:Gamma-glutamylcyclotransferase n=1 Tax=Nitrincola iocasae TaxID=2614693 RepID=A0A5J6LBG1_9GAMM|nr:gamma-glutamylcyclotransferase family protein [Nitrincola iocasae]QEW05905.1 gamma-glutamylcyclotransferase [Nitrincola iocasae]